MEPNDLQVPQVFHVDFSGRELQELLRLVRSRMGLARTSVTRNARRELMDLLKDYRNQFTEAIKRLPQNPIRGRCIDDIRGFVFDLDTDLKRRRVKATKEPMILSLERDNYDRQGAMARSSRVSSLLLAREVSGQRGYGSMRSLQNFTNEFKKCREDGLELRTEWANCAGDIATITWVSNDGFICGTTEHSDPHNQQYNKPGNLVLGSCSQGTLRAFADHRIERPVVEKGENSTAAMRRSQDPWLYTSVVSSDYDGAHDRAYTCGFDRTVKVWKVDKSGATMSLLGTWPHDGNVNFVVASKHASGVVATAADVAADAVRIYHVDFLDVSGSPFRSHSCSRVVDLEGNTVSTDKWAYFPATIQWGRSEAVQHLVAVGYSPRSRTQDDNDIPEDRRGTGEICVWDGLTGERWNIVSGSKLNVFEILWHPTQPSFIAATSPQGLQGSELDARIRSQVRVFTLSPNPEHGGKAFQVHQTLDCTAVDINELTIM
jgi:WD40 repeat protein